MTVSRREGSEVGFTVVFCVGRHCRTSFPVRERLGAAARECKHGMLVGSECLFGPHGCPGRTPPPVPGAPVLLVQRCVGVERRPLGPTTTVGPLRTRRDLEAVCRWLSEPGQALPRRLDPSVRKAAAASN
jgi:hypothetical protein